MTTFKQYLDEELIYEEDMVISENVFSDFMADLNYVKDQRGKKGQINDVIIRKSYTDARDKFKVSYDKMPDVAKSKLV